MFAYGTLEVPEVMQAVTGRGFDSAVAIAEGYARYLLKERIYPGMTPVPGEETSGRVYFGLSQQTLRLLDEFEADIYARQLISVRCEAGPWFNAYAYIIKPKSRAVLTNDPWIREKFIKNHLPSYIAACRNFQLRANYFFASGSSFG